MVLWSGRSDLFSRVPPPCPLYRCLAAGEQQLSAASYNFASAATRGLLPRSKEASTQKKLDAVWGLVQQIVEVNEVRFVRMANSCFWIGGSMQSQGQGEVFYPLWLFSEQQLRTRAGGEGCCFCLFARVMAIFGSALLYLMYVFRHLLRRSLTRAL